MNKKGKSAVWIFLVLGFALSWPFLIYGFGWLPAREDTLRRYVFSCTGMLLQFYSSTLQHCAWLRSSSSWLPGLDPMDGYKNTRVCTTLEAMPGSRGSRVSNGGRRGSARIPSEEQ